MGRPAYGLESRFLNEPADTAWYNLGDWSGDPASYPEACEQLARRLALKAGFAPGQSLFDIGCGCAEQDLYWSTHFGLGRIDAITLPGPQLSWARERLASSPHAGRISVVGAGLEEHRPGRSYDHVVALDAAYHLDKALLFQRAAASTEPGGRLSFTDLVWPRPAVKRGRLIRLAGIDPAHLGTLDRLDALARRWGFEPREHEDVSEAVMDGFVRFMRRNRSRLLASLRLGTLRFLLTGEALAHLRRERTLSYQLLTYVRG